MASFFKLSGAGNDFVAFAGSASLGEGEDSRTGDPSAEQIRAWCRRGLSLGADGVMVLDLKSPGVVVMRHFNADGGRSDLCLNGSRCAVRLAGELGWDDGGRVALETDAGSLECRIEGEHKTSIVLPFEVDTPKRFHLETPLGEIEGFGLKVGVPHLVVVLDHDPAEIDISALGPPLRAHADLGPAGANVNFVRYLERDRFELRTWERGVEGETLACGTGAVASARVGAGLGALDLPATALTAGGFELEVGRHGKAMTLAGDARIVAKGELLPGSLV